MTDEYQPHKSSIALLVALLASLVVHGLLAWLATGTKEKRERHQQVSVVTRPSQLAQRPRTEPPPPAPPEPRARASSDAPGSGRAQGLQSHGQPVLDFPLLPGEAPAKPSPRLGTLPSNGQNLGSGGSAKGTGTGGDDGNVALFDPKAIGKTATTFSKPNDMIEGGSGPERGELSEAQRAQSALDHMMTDQNEMYHRDKMAKPPQELLALQVQADRTFNPPADSVAASRIKSTTDEHELGHLVCLVDVSRSAGDEEPTIILAQPSGDKLFDDAALLALKQSLVKGPASYAWSRWRFSAEVYRFSRKEMLLDPGFKPPGRRLSSSSGAMSMTTSVRLLSFR